MQLPSDVPDTVISSILRIAKLHRVRRTAALSAIGIHPGQDSALLLLAECEQCTMSEIARSLAIRPPTVTKIIGRLEANGLVERNGVQGDLRKSAVSLTAAGREHVAEINRIWQGIEVAALTGMPRQNELTTLLRHIESNLSSPIDLSSKVA